jgi:hypothetical protein
VTGNLENKAVSLTFFVASVRKMKLNFLENKSLGVIYITFIYGFFKIFRSLFVSPVSKIPIKECKDPAYILMLIETIELYRLKQMLQEEEELYFLLIDIMRSPDFLKKLSGDSCKSIKNKHHAD